MSKPRYLWRQLTPEQRVEVLEWRKEHQRPWHSPPHRAGYGTQRFHITAACYEHQAFIGQSPSRMDDFSRELLAVFGSHASQLFAWCVLPNHYHALVETPDVLTLLAGLGKLHGRSSFLWNGEESTRGRKVFFRAVEREMRSERHYWATLNYVHHNPVRHGYVEKWVDWPGSSAAEFLAQTGREEAERLWREFPLGDYGKGWDDPEK